ncbi:MAG: acyl carrier protein [Deinococcales bacterium]
MTEWIHQLHSQSTDEAKETLVDYIERQVIDIKKLPANARGKLDHNFMAIGFDSLMSIELLYRLQRI